MTNHFNSTKCRTLFKSFVDFRNLLTSSDCLKIQNPLPGWIRVIPLEHGTPRVRKVPKFYSFEIFHFYLTPISLTRPTADCPILRGNSRFLGNKCNLPHFFKVLRKWEGEKKFSFFKTALWREICFLLAAILESCDSAFSEHQHQILKLANFIMLTIYRRHSD